MFGWRRRSEGFEWREYVRTTVLVRRADRQRRIEDVRVAASKRSSSHAMPALMPAMPEPHSPDRNFQSSCLSLGQRCSICASPFSCSDPLGAVRKGRALRCVQRRLRPVSRCFAGSVDAAGDKSRQCRTSRESCRSSRNMSSAPQACWDSFIWRTDSQECGRRCRCEDYARAAPTRRKFPAGPRQ